MPIELKKLKCLNKDPHNSHNWTFKWDRPETDYRCPGVAEKDGK